jgi:hypothetical protein
MLTIETWWINKEVAIREKCAVCSADFDKVVSLDVNTENDTCTNMYEYLYIIGNKNAGQIHMIKIESKSSEKFRDYIYGNTGNKIKFNT